MSSHANTDTTKTCHIQIEKEKGKQTSRSTLGKPRDFTRASSRKKRERERYDQTKQQILGCFFFFDWLGEVYNWLNDSLVCI